MKLTYRQLEDAIATLHGVAPANRIALQGRIKNFQRSGWPGGTNTGKGTAAGYDFGSFTRLALGFELLEIGLTPERATTVLRDNWETVRTALSLCFNSHASYKPISEPYEVFIYCDPKSLAKLGTSLNEDPTDDTFFYSSAPSLARALLDGRNGMPRRLALINLSSLMTDAAEALGFLFDDWHSHYEAWDHEQRLADAREWQDDEEAIARIEMAGPLLKTARKEE